MLTLNEHIDKENYEYEKYLEEKLIVFNGGKQNGQVIFMAGGGGSGKGFTIDNFVDSRNAKIIDVDAMKQLFIKLSQNPHRWLSDSMRKKAERIDIAELQLKKASDVGLLHDYISGLDIKNKVVENILKGLGQNRPEKMLPNIIFDITGKSMKQFKEFLPMLQAAGYKSNSIHVIWVLQKFSIAVQQNKKRDRRVPKMQMFLTHDGAGQNMYNAMATEFKPFQQIGIDGQFTVVFNDPKFTVFHKDKDGKPIIGQDNPNAVKREFDAKSGKWLKQKRTVVKDFSRVILKREGKPFAPREDAMEMVAAEMEKAMPTLRAAMYASDNPKDREAMKAKGISKPQLRKQLQKLRK